MGDNEHYDEKWNNTSQKAPLTETEIKESTQSYNWALLSVLVVGAWWVAWYSLLQQYWISLPDAVARIIDGLEMIRRS